MLFCVRNGSERLKKGCFFVRNGSVTPREEGFAKQTQVMLLGGWFADDVTAEAYPVSIKLESLHVLRRYSWKKVLEFIVEFPYGPDGRSTSRNHDMYNKVRAWRPAAPARRCVGPYPYYY